MVHDLADLSDGPRQPVFPAVVDQPMLDQTQRCVAQVVVFQQNRQQQPPNLRRADCAAERVGGWAHETAKVKPGWELRKFLVLFFCFVVPVGHTHLFDGVVGRELDRRHEVVRPVVAVHVGEEGAHRRVLHPTLRQRLQQRESCASSFLRNNSEEFKILNSRPSHLEEGTRHVAL